MSELHLLTHPSFYLANILFPILLYPSFTPIGTTNGICSALLIAIKQLIPDHKIGTVHVGTTANYLPLIYLAICFALTVLTILPIGAFIFTLTAVQASWLYLRYFRYSNGTHGDFSDAFAYSTLFPTPIRPVISVISNIAFHSFKPLLMSVQQTPPESMNETSAQPSKASAFETERRRQRALKVLDERLQETIASEPVPDVDSKV